MTARPDPQFPSMYLDVRQSPRNRVLGEASGMHTNEWTGEKAFS